ncbi:hypothetical protein SARC_11463, partial [Sphaeroforma arctica JP610]
MSSSIIGNIALVYGGGLKAYSDVLLINTYISCNFGVFGEGLAIGDQNQLIGLEETTSSIYSSTNQNAADALAAFFDRINNAYGVNADIQRMLDRMADPK